MLANFVSRYEIDFLRTDFFGLRTTVARDGPLQPWKNFLERGRLTFANQRYRHAILKLQGLCGKRGQKMFQFF